MFAGISSVLKGHVQQSIIEADRNLTDDFAKKVLKALFLVKYIREFKATVRSVTVLMYDKFGCDQPALKQKVQAALDLLEQETYIQRNGEFYEFLTDEEKDIEAEIKGQDIESNSPSDELSKMIFEEILKTRKIRYAANKQDYPFSKKLDDRAYGPPSTS